MHPIDREAGACESFRPSWSGTRTAASADGMLAGCFAVQARSVSVALGTVAGRNSRDGESGDSALGAWRKSGAWQAVGARITIRLRAAQPCPGRGPPFIVGAPKAAGVVRRRGCQSGNGCRACIRLVAA